MDANAACARCHHRRGNHVSDGCAVVASALRPATFCTCLAFIPDSSAGERAGIAAMIRAAQAGAISAADRAMLADGDWRTRAAAENSERVALAVLDYAAGIAETVEDGVGQRIRKMVEDGYRDGQTRWSGGEILEQVDAVDTVTPSKPSAPPEASTYWWARANDVEAKYDRLQQEVREGADYLLRLADAARVDGDHHYADAYEHAAERTLRTLTLAAALDA